jgi:hypothetical protein
MTLTPPTLVVSGALLLSAIMQNVAFSAEVRMCQAQTVRVLTVGERPAFVSGVIATFVEIRAQCGQEVETAYIPYMIVSQWLPNEGDDCHVRYRSGRLSGLVGLASMRIDGANIVSAIECVDAKP